MRLALEIGALLVLVAADIAFVRTVRRRRRADETYHPADGSILVLLFGGLAFLAVLGLMSPWPFSAAIFVPTFSGAFWLVFWYFKGHRPASLKRYRPQTRRGRRS